MGETGKICFQVEGAFVVNIARSLWADELEVVKAMRILVNGIDGVTEDLAVKILSGRATFTGMNELELVPDNTLQSEMGNELSMESVMMRLMTQATDEDFEMMVFRQTRLGHMKFITSPWGAGWIPYCVFNKMRNNEMDYDEVKKYFTSHLNYEEKNEPEIVDEAIDTIYTKMRTESIKEDNECLEDPELTDEHSSSWRVSTGILDRYLSDQRKQEELRSVEPKPAKSFQSENGWIAPSGAFYECGMIEHEFLAGRLHSDGKKLEKTHVRISINPCSGYRSPIQFVGRKLTKKQKDSIWDWCSFHKVDVPSWVFNDGGTKLSDT